jgi:hypothetical protein
MKKLAAKNLKLKLNRETVRALETPDLEGVAGGVTLTCVSCPMQCPTKISCKWTCVNGSCTC